MQHIIGQKNDAALWIEHVPGQLELRLPRRRRQQWNAAAEQMELRLYLLGDSVADFLTVVEGQHQDIALVGVTNSFSIG